MGDEFPRFVAAVAQASPVFLEREATVAKACRLIEEARDHGAALIAFPETWIPTYPFWVNSHVWFNPIEEERHLTRAARKVFVELYKNSVEIPSPTTEALCRAAKKAGIYVVMGINERDTDFRGTLYNTLLYIDKSGQIRGRHRKLMPTYTERTVWGQGDGSGLQVFDSEIGRLGGLICFEHQMTLVKYAMFAKGEQIHVAAWPSAVAHFTDYASRQYAIEGQVFVLVAGCYMNEDEIPDDFPLKRITKWDTTGGSCVINPRGYYLAGPVFGKEEILYAEIDLTRIVEAKQSLDTIGHYARPDVVRLLLDESRRTPMEVMTKQSAEYAGLPVPDPMDAGVPQVDAIDALTGEDPARAIATLRRVLDRLERRVTTRDR